MENDNLAKDFCIETLELMVKVGESELTLRKYVMSLIESKIISNKDMPYVNSILERRKEKQYE